MKFLYINLIVFFVCQTVKIFYSFVKEKKIDLSAFMSDGGMPSSHSALSTSASTLIYFDSGPESSIFVLALVFTMVVINDSLKVRRDVGKQAVALNRIMEAINMKDRVDQNERNGHRFIEVLIGIIVGVSLSTLLLKYVFI